MSNTNSNGLQQHSMDKPSPPNAAFSEVVKELFGDIQQYETDIPQNFARPCFLFINPDKETKTKELSAGLHQIFYRYEIQFYAVEDDVEGLTHYKNEFIDYLMSVKKVLIPDTDRRYFLIENVAADVNDFWSMVTFMVEVSRIQNRNRRIAQAPKIRKIVNTLKVDGGEVVSVETKY